MTVSDPEAVRPTSRFIWVVGVCAGLVCLVGWFLITEFGSYVSPWVILGCCAALMIAADVLALAVVARRSTARAAIRCSGVGLAALVIQAGGGYLSALLFLDLLTFAGTGWLLWTLPAIALALSTVLLGGRSRRRYGWAVLMGSAEGFALSIGFFVAAIEACNCMD